MPRRCTRGAGADPGRRPPRPRGDDHRALRGATWRALTAALPVCDGILASPSRCATWRRRAPSSPEHRTYLSINRTGLAGSRLRARRPAGGERGSRRRRRVDRHQAHDPDRPGRPRSPRPPWSCSATVLDDGPGRRARGARSSRCRGRRRHGARHRRHRLRRRHRPRPRAPRCSRCPCPTSPRAGDADRGRGPRGRPAWACPCSSSAGPGGRRRARPARDPGRVLDEVRDAMAGGAAGHGHGSRRLPGPRPGRRWPGWWPTPCTGPRRPASLILTLDLGTTTTKAVVWGDDGPLAVGRAALETTYPAGDRAEQDPADVVAVGGGRLRRGPGRHARRASFAGPSRPSASPPPARPSSRSPPTASRSGPRCCGPTGGPRPRRRAAGRRRSGGRADAVRRRTGVVPRRGVGGGQGGVARAPRAGPARRAARWLLTPRDLVGVAADRRGGAPTGTMASADRPLDCDGGLGPARAGPLDATRRSADRLPDAVVASDAVAGRPARRGPAPSSGLPAGVPVVIGAGDRACEVLGAGASPTRPMVSWGTTANVSVPVADLPEPAPAGDDRHAAAPCGGWLLEGGLSAAGSARRLAGPPRRRPTPTRSWTGPGRARPGPAA